MDGDGNGQAACDRGAVEVLPPTPTPLSFTVDAGGAEADASPGDALCRTATGTCTFTAAVTEANIANGRDTITLPVGGVVAAPGLILSDVVVRGRDATITGTVEIAPVEAAIDHVKMVHPYPATILRSWSTAATLDHVTITTAGTGLDNRGTLSFTNGRVVSVNQGITAPITNVGTLSIADSTVDYSGGRTGDVSSSGDLTIRRSTLRNATIVSGGRVLVESSTSAAPGALYVYGGSAELRHSTFVGGIAFTIQVVVGSSGPPTVVLRNTIVGQPVGKPACIGAVSSDGYNLGQDSSCHLTATGDVQGVGAALGLGALADNGGPTLTYLPAAGSPAVDGGDPACPALDQRGTPRPRGASCDRGAVER